MNVKRVGLSANVAGNDAASAAGGGRRIRRSAANAAVRTLSGVLGAPVTRLHVQPDQVGMELSPARR